MKKLLLLLRDLSSELLSKIEKKEMVISSSKTIPFVDNQIKGVSDEEAVSILQNTKNYKKDTKEFSEDSSRIVLSKKVFLNFLRIFPETDLFLFRYLSSEKKTWIHPRSHCRRILDRAKEDSDKIIRNIFFSAALLFASVFVGLLLGLKKDESNIYFFCFIAFLILLFSAVFFYEFFRIKKVLKVRKEINTSSTIEDIFFYGYDVEHLDESDSQQFPLEILFLPEKSPIQSTDFIAKFISLKSTKKEAAVGYLLCKSGGRLKAVERELLAIHSEDFISVVVLADSIIFPLDSVEKFDIGTIEQVKVREFFEKESFKLFL